MIQRRSAIRPTAMKSIFVTNPFKKDAAALARRGYDRVKLDAIVRLLAADQPLPARCRPHKLHGDWEGVWECHVGSDWLLIYEFTDTTLTLHRTGTHADLF
jgi:mRNA interferase YafQ